MKKFAAMALLACVALLPACGGSAAGGAAVSPLDPVLRAPDASASQPIFDEEFDGTALDEARWSTCYPWAFPGCTNGGHLELEWYVPAGVAVGSGLATLTARIHQIVANHPYTSGMIATGGKPHEAATFAYRYGYAEARIKLPRGAGMWPAFWLVPANRTWPPEIDIMEWQGVSPRTDIVTIHWGKAKDPQQDGTAVDTGKNLWAGFHTYGLDWQPTRVVWYFDGKPIKTYSGAHVPHQPMYPILNLAIGGWYKGQLDPSPASFPATMSVDYVRVWKTMPATRTRTYTTMPR